MFLAGNLTVFSSFVSRKVAPVDCLKGKKHCSTRKNDNAAPRPSPPTRWEKREAVNPWSATLQALPLGRMFIPQNQVQHGTVLRAFHSHSPPEEPEPPEPVTGKPPRPTAGAAVSMTLPFQSNMGNKRSWQLGGPQLQDRSSVWNQNKREWREGREENWSREESKLIFSLWKSKRKREL